MVITVDSFSDDSTVCALNNEKDAEDLRIIVVSQISPKSGPNSGNMVIEVKDIETSEQQRAAGVQTPKPSEEAPPKLIHP